MTPRQRNAEPDDDDALEGDGMTALEGEGAEQEKFRRGSRNPDEKDIDAFMVEMDDQAEFVSLRRYDSSVSDWVILGKIDATEATSEAIRARFGGGKYRARIIDSEGRHGKMLTFRLSGAPKNPDDEQADGATKVLTDRIAQLEKSLLEKNNAPPTGQTTSDRLMEAIVTRILTTDNSPKTDPLVLKLIEAMIAGRPSSSGKDIDPIELQKLLQQARGEGMEIGKQLGSAESMIDAGEVSVGNILARELPKLTEIIVNAQGNKGASNRRRITAPQETPKTLPQTTTQTPTQTEPVSDNPIAKYLAPVVPVILGWAKKGKTPEVKAVNMIDDLTEQQKDTIGSMAENEDFVGMVMAAVPQFNSPDVKEWCTSFLQAVQDTLAPAADDDATETATDIPAQPSDNGDTDHAEA